MRVALMVTCLGDVLFPQVGRATVALLERLGHEVVFPAGQTCCGQMHVNTGYRRAATALVGHHVEVFEPYDVVVAPSGSCVGCVRHQHADLAHRAGDQRLAARAEAVAGRTYELSELLVDVLGVTDVGAHYPHRVTYHPTCHSLRMLRGRATGRLRLLRGGARDPASTTLPAAEQCCGFGGTFAVKNADTSVAMGADKMPVTCSRDRRRGAASPATTSCLMHIGGDALGRLSRRACARDAPRRGARHDRGRCTPVQRAPAGTASREPPKPVPSAHLRRRHAALPRPRRATALADTAAAPQPRPRDRPRSATSGPRWSSPRSTDWEEVRLSPVRRSRKRDAGATSTSELLVRLERDVIDAQPERRCTGPATPPRRARSSAAGWPRATTCERGGQGQVDWPPPRSSSTTPSPPSGIAAWETDLAELIVQLGDDLPQPHPGARDPPQPRRDPRDLRSRQDGRRRSSRDLDDLTDEPRILAMAAARQLPAARSFLARQGRGSPVPTSPSPRPGPSVVVESEGNGRMCLTLPRRC